NHQPGLNRLSIAEFHPILPNRTGRPPQKETNPVLFVEILDPPAEFLAQHFLQGDGIRPDDGDLETSMPKRSSHFQADETGPNHHAPLGSFGLSDNRPAVSQGS